MTPALPSDQADPIVVTGLGAVSPLGVGMEAAWRGLMAGRSGIRRNDRFDTSDYACRIAGLVPGRDEPDGLDPLAVWHFPADISAQLVAGILVLRIIRIAHHAVVGDRSLLGHGIDAERIGLKDCHPIFESNV